MLAHPVHPLLNLVDEGADNIHKNPVDTSSKRPLPANRVGGRRVTKAIKHRKTSTAPPERMDWRLNDSTFDQLDAMFHFTLEACCDDKGLNGHCKYDPDTDTRSNTVMPFCSPSNSILNRNVVGESIFVHPPWSKATAIVSHIRRCHAKDPQNTLAIFVLPKFPAFAPVLEGLRLLDEQLADRTTFTKSPPTDGGVRNPVYPPKTPLCFWVLDKDTPVLPQYLDNDNLDNTADDEVELNQDGTRVSENIILDDNLAANNESDIEKNLDNNVAGDFEGLPPLRPGFDHKVKLTSTPKRQRRSRLSHPQIQEVVRQCTEHFKQGRVQVSTSPHAAPIILIRKPDGSMRMCIDYRSVNTCSERDSFPLPRIDDLLDKLRDAKIMTHLDLNQAYHQVRMDPDSVSATAFQGTTPSGAPCLLEFLVMPFGLQGAGATFTRLMNHVLEPYLNKFVLVYLDDICIFSSSEEEHLEHLSLVLAMLKKHQLRVRLKKCHWGQKESEYLGVIAGNGHLRCSPAKLSAVKDWPVPSTQKEIKSFVQFCSFYRKFVHHFSDCSAMLTDLCRKNAPQKVTLDDGALTAFETLKARLCSAPLLLIPKTGPDAEFVVATDASDVGIGAVLLQEGPTGDLQPVAYFGRKLNPAQRRYSAYDKEAYAAVTAVCDEWKVYLEGCRHFTVITDHATLTHLQSQSSESLTNRQQHYVEKIQPFAGYMSLIYRKGCLNEADPISRRPDFFSIWGEADVNPSMVDLMALHVDNITVDGDFERKLKGAYSSCKYFSDATRLTRDKIIKGDDGLFRYLGRIVIPHPAEDLRKTLLHEYHDCIAGGGHSSPKRTLAKIMEKFWWRQMSADVQKYCRECVVCKRAKPVRRGPAPLDTLPIPDHPWQIVGLDYVTSLPESGGPKKGSAMYNAILVVCCLGGGGAHFIPCRDTVTAEESADLFLREVVRLHGVPSVLVSDRDPKFVSDFWQQLWRSLGTKLNMSTARRAQTDGKSERTIGSAQCLLRCYCAESGFDWLSHSGSRHLYRRCSSETSDMLTQLSAQCNEMKC